MCLFSNKKGGAESNNMDGEEDVPFDPKMVMDIIHLNQVINSILAFLSICIYIYTIYIYFTI